MELGHCVGYRSQWGECGMEYVGSSCIPKDQVLEAYLLISFQSKVEAPAKWLPSAAAVTTTILRNDPRPSSAPASLGRWLGQPVANHLALIVSVLLEPRLRSPQPLAWRIKRDQKDLGSWSPGFFERKEWKSDNAERTYKVFPFKVKYQDADSNGKAKGFKKEILLPLVRDEFFELRTEWAHKLFEAKWNKRWRGCKLTAFTAYSWFKFDAIGFFCKVLPSTLQFLSQIQILI